ncbi:DUF7282 domain-containing protein [Pelagibacterium sp.]|uniref:DUF7282 domain-containing protein n=1 Tax=Pelagibacterium sp. TaxID=1967288 RepID=UPI003BAA23C7
MLKQSIVALALASSALVAGPALADHLNIETDGIQVDGDMVTIASVLIDEPGFVVIHEVLDGSPVVPASIGHAYVEAGTTDGVEITTDYPLADGADYIAMLHYDTDGDGEYSFGEGMTDVDTPALNAEDAPYVQPFTAGASMM